MKEMNIKTKESIINEIVTDLPMKSVRHEMTDEEWFGWFEECWDKAVAYTKDKS